MRTFLFVLAFLLFPALVHAQSGPVGDANLGYQFAPPDGWIAQQVEGGFLLGSHSQYGFVLVLPHEYTTLDQIRAEAQQGLHEAGGTSLQLSSDLVDIGSNGIGGEFGGTIEWQQAKAYAVSILSPHGNGGLTILAATDPTHFSDTHRDVAKAIARSAEFAEPPPAPVASSVPSGSPWHQRLVGARLQYLYSYYSGGVDGSYVGASEKTIIDVCEAGYFNYYSNNTLAADGGGGAGYNVSGYTDGRQQGQGRWEIAQRGGQTLLLLHFHNGNVSEYALTTNDDNHTLLNGERFFVTRGAYDPEDAPDCY